MQKFLRGKSLPRSMFLVTAAMMAYGSVSVDLYLPTFLALQSYFVVPLRAIQITMTIYLSVAIVGQLIYGLLIDVFGRRRPLLAATALLVGGSLVMAGAFRIEMLYAGRVFQAFGAAAGSVVARALVRDMIEDNEEAARTYSSLTAVMGVAPVIGPVVGSGLLTMFGWRAVFFVQALFGIVCIGAIVKYLPETLGRSARIAAKKYDPLLAKYARLLKNNVFRSHSLGLMGAFASFFVYITCSSAVFMADLSLSRAIYGLIFMMNAAALIVCARLNAEVIKRVSCAKVVHIAGFYGVVGTMLVLYGYSGDQASLLPILAGFLLVNISIGFTSGNSVGLAMGSVSANSGLASSTIGVLLYLGGVLSTLIVEVCGGSGVAIGLVMLFGFVVLIVAARNAGDS